MTDAAAPRPHVTLGFVIPWYGPDLPGGAEAQTRATVTHLAEAGYRVEILTTCIENFHADWGHNHYPPGSDTVDGIPVRRFPVEPRDRDTFDALNWHLMHGQLIPSEAETTFIQEMIRAPALYEYLRAHADRYLYFFIPYMFSTTYFGVRAVPDRAVVIPCLHDEAYARMDLYREALPRARALIFNSHMEAELAERLYPEHDQRRIVAGEGIELPAPAEPSRFRTKYGLQKPFLLYVGRRERGKNIPLLLEYWARYIQEHDDPWTLALAGPGRIAIPQSARARTVDLGFIPKADKYDAYAAASVFINPSINESFSLVLMESWLAATPALVHGDCAVTRDHVQRAGGGLYFRHYEEFAATLRYLRRHEETATRMGQLGRRYVLENFQWDTIIGRYRQLIDELLKEERVRER